MKENPEALMLHAISILGKAKAMVRSSKIMALKNLISAVKLMNRAIDMDPENIENRKYRLRHLLGVTMNSPKSFIKEVEEDLDFFRTRDINLNREDKSYYLAVLGEYEIYKGNREIGINILENIVEEYSDTSIYDYVRVYLNAVFA